MMTPRKTGGPDARRVAEERFAKITQAEKKARKEREKAKMNEEAHTARLRALRLAKEAAERETAAAAAQEAALRAPAKTKRSASKG